MSQPAHNLLSPPQREDSLFSDLDVLELAFVDLPSLTWLKCTGIFLTGTG